MTSSPVSLDSLLSYVEHLHPDGAPLARLSDAVLIGSQLNETGDALIGHFVDQARRSGASWSQIGASMGVSKQAAQQRHVGRRAGGSEVPPGQLSARFTPRTLHVLAVAAASAGDGEVEARHIVAAAVAEPQALAGLIVAELRSSPEAVADALGVQLTASQLEPVDEVQALPLDASAQALLERTVRVALDLGHNYVGTEHLLLGGLAAGSEIAPQLREAGLDEDAARAAVTELLARIQAKHGRPSASSTPPGRE